MKSAVKKRRAKSICSANAIAPGRTSSPRLRAVVSYINDNREVVLEHTAMEIATATQTSDATVVRAIRALASPGCASLSRPWSAGSAPRSPRRKRCARRLPRSPATSTPVLILCLKAISGCARSCRGPTTARRWLRRWHCSATRARGDLRYRRLGDPRRIHRPVVQPYWPAGVRDEPHGL